MPAVDLGARLVPTYTGPGSATAVNVLHFRNIGGEFDTAAGDELLAAWANYVVSMMSEDWTLNSTADWLDISEDPPEALVAEHEAGGAPVAEPPTPACMAYCVSLIAGGGRRGRGRIYIPGISEFHAEDGSTVPATFQEYAIDGFLDFAATAAALLGWAPAVYSRVDGVVRPATAVEAGLRLDTQVRRLRRIDEA